MKLPIPKTFTVQDLKHVIESGNHPEIALKSLNIFITSCPGNFDDFPEREQVLMSFAFLQGFMASTVCHIYKEKGK